MADRQELYPSSGDPILVYTFDNVSGTTVYDEIGSNDATIDNPGRTTIGSGGRINDAALHTGSAGSSKIILASSSPWQSLSFYASRADASTNYFGTVCNNNDVQALEFQAGGAVKVFSVTSSYTCTDTDIHHVVLTRAVAGNGVHLYVDNVYIEEVACDANSTYDIEYLGTPTNVAGYFHATLDIFHLYDYLLSVADVNTLFKLEGIIADFPMFGMEITGSIEIGMSLDAPMPMFDAEIVADIELQADIDAPFPMFGAEIISTNYANISIPFPMLGASVVFGGDIDIPFPMFGVEFAASQPAEVDINVPFPMFGAEVSGYVTGLVNIAAAFPMFGTEITITSQPILTIEATFPMFEAEVSGYIGNPVVVIPFPMFRIEFKGDSLIDDSILQYIRGAVR